jgi:hypothetical protein
VYQAFCGRKSEIKEGRNGSRVGVHGHTKFGPCAGLASFGRELRELIFARAGYTLLTIQPKDAEIVLQKLAIWTVPGSDCLNCLLQK